jgi:hypothetical protein
VNLPSVFENREEYSVQRLDELRMALRATNDAEPAGACLYVTGSYGRLEATEHSDLDLFIVDGVRTAPLGRIKSWLMRADIVRVARELNFAEFTGDARYLEAHTLPEMVKHIGGPEDDARNFFTARLLLLLEGQPLVGLEAYTHVREAFLKEYLRDYLRHREDFRPTFFLNDVARFWKTLALNYERARNELVRSTMGGDPAVTNPDVWARHSLKNLKLKFSRLMTCYSGVIAVASSFSQGTLDPDSLAESLDLSPVARLHSVRERDPRTDASVSAALEEYAWFLQFTEAPVAEQVASLQDLDFRSEAFSRATEFGDRIYEAVVAATDGTALLRFLVV